MFIILYSISLFECYCASKQEQPSRWTDEVHVVQSASGKTVQLTDGQTLRRDKVLLVPHDTVMTTEKNVIKVATKQHRDKQFFERENRKQTDVIESGRAGRSGRGVLKTDSYFEGNK